MAAPTLLVGLGGAGSDIVRRVFNLATPKQRKNIAFVIFDTDVNELRQIEEHEPQIRTVQISTKLTVGEYLDCDHYSRDNWFPVNRVLNSKALTEGAGQVRAVSRLALNSSIQQGKMAPLDEAIEQLYKLNGQKTVQAPRVIVAGSLCGGTGSGLVLPVSLYIRNFITTKLQQSSAIIRGFFLLPEIFNGVIKTQSERNNLRSNAYAAVREIDAFLMKDDGTLPEKYDLHFMAPRPGSRGQDEYLGRPMDFCFLFDGQNLDGMKLNSTEEYKDHAANCIYGMAIAPTSKRSNSSEDNVIREIVFAGGRNRYAGAGTSMLIYPTEDVKRYLALQWTKDTISREWLEVDRKFHEKDRENRDRRRKGYQVESIDRGEDYVDTINRGQAEHLPFEAAIRDLCIEHDPNGYVEKSLSWMNYISELDGYIGDQISLQMDKLKDLIEDVNAKSSAARENNADVEAFTAWYAQLLGFKTATIKVTNSLSNNIEYTLFKESSDYTRTREKFRIEYWLRQNGNEDSFIHPNAVRYFLYNVLSNLRVREAEEKIKVDNITAYWADFEKKTFDLPDTEEVETQDEYFEASHLNEEGIARLFHHSAIAEVRANLTGKFGTLYSKTKEYWEAYVSYKVYNSAINFVKALCDSFHDFYDVLGRSISSTDREIAELEAKYDPRPGVALRYVCADRECLRELSNEAINDGSSLDLPSDLSSEIYLRVREYALSEKKPSSDRYFTDLFKNTVVGFLEKEIVRQYDSLVNMDIISALEKEAVVKRPDIALDLVEQEFYAKHIIESTEILAKPFIESPVGKEPRVIPACAYNPELSDERIPGRAGFVSANLKDRGGVDDDSIDRNTILFYQSVYDLRVNDLSKFAPPKEAETYDRPGGEYYKAYHELVRQIHPESQKSKAITPHIDRLWHAISKLPELDEKEQKKQEDEIYAAFFWAMLGKYVNFERVNETTSVYRPDRKALGLSGEDSDNRLVVSNGTPCDHLYEVLDSFTIYPELVEVVRKKFNARVDRDLYRKVPLEESFLFEMLGQYRIDEYEMEDKDAVRSIFALPILMKHSVPSELYFEENMISLLETIFSEIKAYVARFVNKKEFAEAYSKLLRSQFDLFIRNMTATAERDGLENVFEDSLFTYICKSVADELDELGFHKASVATQETVRSLKR
ncbi:MAG: tubulin-like doman-containing protein [Oscillospiraceae bacterium]|nr:tubulin-like doman-containing protein [Oscillospiraceae bacterium]